MKEYSTEQLQEAFERLPQKLQAAVSSPDIHQRIMNIGNRHGLHIDQIGELTDQIGLVMLGLENSSNFVRDTSSRLSIGMKDAQEIANDINKEVFSAIKTNMRELEEKTESASATPASDARRDMAALERAGGFSVEPSLASSSADGEESAPDSNEVNESDKNDILSGIENPKPAPSMSSPKAQESHTEPLVDHLLGNASGQTEQKIVHKTEEPPANLPMTEETPVATPAQPAVKPIIPPPKPTPPPRRGPDPYHEPVE